MTKLSDSTSNVADDSSSPPCLKTIFTSETFTSSDEEDSASPKRGTFFIGEPLWKGFNRSFRSRKNNDKSSVASRSVMAEYSSQNNNSAFVDRNPQTSREDHQEINLGRVGCDGGMKISVSHNVSEKNSWNWLLGKGKGTVATDTAADEEFSISATQEISAVYVDDQSEANSHQWSLNDEEDQSLDQEIAMISQNFMSISKRKSIDGADCTPVSFSSSPVIEKGISTPNERSTEGILSKSNIGKLSPNACAAIISTSFRTSSSNTRQMIGNAVANDVSLHEQDHGASPPCYEAPLVSSGSPAAPTTSYIPSKSNVEEPSAGNGNLTRFGSFSSKTTQMPSNLANDSILTDKQRHNQSSPFDETMFVPSTYPAAFSICSDPEIVVLGPSHHALTEEDADWISQNFCSSPPDQTFYKTTNCIPLSVNTQKENCFDDKEIIPFIFSSHPINEGMPASFTFSTRIPSNTRNLEEPSCGKDSVLLSTSFSTSSSAKTQMHSNVDNSLRDERKRNASSPCDEATQTTLCSRPQIVFLNPSHNALTKDDASWLSKNFTSSLTTQSLHDRDFQMEISPASDTEASLFNISNTMPATKSSKPAEGATDVLHEVCSVLSQKSFTSYSNENNDIGIISFSPEVSLACSSEILSLKSHGKCSYGCELPTEQSFVPDYILEAGDDVSAASDFSSRVSQKSCTSRFLESEPGKEAIAIEEMPPKVEQGQKTERRAAIALPPSPHDTRSGTRRGFLSKMYSRSKLNPVATADKAFIRSFQKSKLAKAFMSAKHENEQLLGLSNSSTRGSTDLWYPATKNDFGSFQT